MHSPAGWAFGLVWHSEQKMTVECFQLPFATLVWHLVHVFFRATWLFGFLWHFRHAVFLGCEVANVLPGFLWHE